jgi:hypothetical protein
MNLTILALSGNAVKLKEGAAGAASLSKVNKIMQRKKFVILSGNTLASFVKNWVLKNETRSAPPPRHFEK